MKACPYCWEKIQNIAKKCRYCWEWLEEKENTEKKEKENNVKMNIKNQKSEEKNTTKNSIKNEWNDEKYLKTKANEFKFWYFLGAYKRIFFVFAISLLIIFLVCWWNESYTWLQNTLIICSAVIITFAVCIGDFLPKTVKKATDEHIERVKQPLKPEDKKDYSIIAKIFLWVILWFFWLLTLAVVIWFLKN